MGATDAFVYEDDRTLNSVARRNREYIAGVQKTDRQFHRKVVLLSEMSQLAASHGELDRPIAAFDEDAPGKRFTLIALAAAVPSNAPANSVVADAGKDKVLTEATPERGIPLSRLLQFGAVFGGLLCLASLAGWVATAVPLVNPFIALLGLVAAPFFFWMGRLAR